MNTLHLKYIRCAACGGELESRGEHQIVQHGVVRCTVCHIEFPVIDHVPRLLTGHLLESCIEYYRNRIDEQVVLSDWYARHRERRMPAQTLSAIERKKILTQRNFGYEWKIWRKLPEYAEQHFLRIMGCDEGSLRNKTGYDAATGMGRYLHAAALAVGNEGMMIGTDISYAVDMAYARCRDLTNVLIVQADLYSRVIPDASVDFAFMIGLVQHLTDPAGGIRQVVSKVKPGGYFVATVYTKPADMLSRMVVAFIYMMRIVTTHASLPIVLFISRVCAVPAYLFFKLPHFILRRLRYVQEMNRLYPDHGTQNRKPDLDLLAHNWFDHFTPPVIGFYSDTEIRALLHGTPLDSVTLALGVVRAHVRETPRV